MVNIKHNKEVLKLQGCAILSLYYQGDITYLKSELLLMIRGYCIALNLDYYDILVMTEVPGGIEYTIMVKDKLWN